MPALAMLVFLLAPFAVRAPVGLEGWDADTDPVHHRVGGLLAGEPVLMGSVAIVPLHARVPSEARWDREAAPRWAREPLSGRIVRERDHLYLRLANPGPEPLLVVAGTAFAAGKAEVYLARDAVVTPRFAALLPIRAQGGPIPKGPDPLKRIGVLPPLSAGAILLDRGTLAMRTMKLWRKAGNGGLFRGFCDQAEVRRLRLGLERAAKGLLRLESPTLVGAVFLIGNRPAAAHVFATRELFAAALPDLLAGIAGQARLAEIDAGGRAPVALRAVKGDARGRALAFLRGMLGRAGEWSESYGQGFEILVRNARDGVIGHGLVTHRHRVVHVAFLMLGGWWLDARGRRRPAGRGAGPGAAARPRPARSIARPALRSPRRASAPGARALPADPPDRVGPRWEAATRRFESRTSPCRPSSGCTSGSGSSRRRCASR